MQLPHYLAALVTAERRLADGYDQVTRAHAGVADVALTSRSFAEASRARADALAAACEDRYPGGTDEGAPASFAAAQPGPLALLSDLAELARLAGFVHTAWEVVVQAASGLRDRDLLSEAQQNVSALETEAAWIDHKTKSEAAQAVLVAE
ncbi:hypothetical protein PU630_01420 [Microbacterium horticulturae]|uniref:DUF892 family protein n=1 Tax=Microbacterium horticulturae TaxID=3028316 RepID=A0ABY8C1L8_9MICO|nr:hypothetical protein [Microbacterium sp. KACC 23027]WEG09247.1 hypothetical protein PU630_01420 [Microbacterium sp. KACC 23027]